MTIPKKYQVFDSPVKLTDQEAAFLTEHLSGWMKLHAFLHDGVSENDLRGLLTLELFGMRRRSIIDRLVGRISSATRKKIHTRVEAALK